MARMNYDFSIFNIDDFPLNDPGFVLFKDSDRPTFPIGQQFSFAAIGPGQRITVSDSNGSLTDADTTRDQYINFADPTRTITVEGGQVWGNGTQIEGAWSVSLRGDDGSQFTIWGVTFNDRDNDVQAFITTGGIKLGVTYTIVTYSTNNGAAYVYLVCFGAGTLIATPDGPRPVEMLGVGDLVLCNDGQAFPVRWAGARAVTAAEMAADPRLKPIRIAAGALGAGTPARDLIVSPQHRMLIRSAIARRMFGTDEVLVAAVHLLGAEGIARIETPADISYHHLMLDEHRILLAEGAEAESMLPGPVAMSGLPDAARTEILTLFPELEFHSPVPARPIIKGARSRRLIERQMKNRKPLVAARPQGPAQPRG
ncbi:MAG: Hint domain-containing protein [Paracoccus sp. (in: a-proteobacteria)]|nr:Hint domain-containing protein [Paracoccus sp. (in: a-proteobacteria)]